MPAADAITPASMPLSAAYAMLRQMPALRCCRIFTRHYAEFYAFLRHYAYAAADAL